MYLKVFTDFENKLKIVLHYVLHFQKQKRLNLLFINLLRRFKMWYLQGSNQGHMDFQSIALPSELRYLTNAGANIE